LQDQSFLIGVDFTMLVLSGNCSVSNTHLSYSQL